MALDREIELKLELDEPDQAAILSVLGLGEGAAKRLCATYYDTPKQALRDARISFRVRRSDDSFVQTIKVARGNGAGLFDRAEWEKTIDGDSPDLAAVDDAGLRDLLHDPRQWKKIVPAFTVDVCRTVWRVASASSDIEVVLDAGKVTSGETADSIGEIELELKDGTPEALFGLARRVLTALPVRIGVLTKAERGYRLLSGEAEKATKAGPLTLPKHATTADAFAMIVQDCLRHFRLNEPLVEARNAAGLHQARVALRRMRSALSLFRRVAGDERFDEFRVALRGMASVLGEARNLDVLIERFREGEVAGANLEALGQEREAAYDRAIAELQSHHSRRLIFDILEWSEIGAWRRGPSTGADPETPAAIYAAEMLDRQRRRVKKRGEGLAGLDFERQHQVRIDAKRLRYAAEFFASLFGRDKQRRRYKSFLTAVEDVQSHLGALNDIATARELASGLAAKGIKLPATDIDKMRLLRKAEAAYDELISIKPFWR